MTEYPIESLREYAEELKRLSLQGAGWLAYGRRSQNGYDIHGCTLRIIRIISLRSLERSYVLKRLDHNEVARVMKAADELHSMTLLSVQSFMESKKVSKKAQELSILLSAAVDNKVDDPAEYLAELINELSAAHELRNRTKWKEAAQSLLGLAIRVFEPNQQALEALESKVHPVSPNQPEDRCTRTDILELWKVRSIVEACTDIKTSCNKLIEFAEAYHDLSKVPPSELELLINIFANNQEEVCGNARRLMRCLNHQTS